MKDRSTRPRVRIVEVGPRDGLQNEARPIPTGAKVQFINRLSRTGLTEIEVGAFVRPDRIPQMADTAKVFDRIKRPAGVTYSALVPNEKGLERALQAKVDKIATFTAASETFNRKNTHATIAESIARFRPVIAEARAAKLKTRAYISTGFWCPYEGRISPNRVLQVCRKLLDIGISEISVGDTIGKASPDEVRRLLERLLPKLGRAALFLHLHDTYGMAVANALCAFQEFGVTGFDSSAGGLGGCPYAPGGSGNIATEDLLFALQACGARVAARPSEIAAAARPLIPILGHPLTSRLSRLKDFLPQGRIK